jgi:MbtH protein
MAIDDDKVVYKVVVNSEEQYSLSFAGGTNPPGWRDAGKHGTKAECLAYVEQVWTDMTPLRVRKSQHGN